MRSRIESLALAFLFTCGMCSLAQAAPGKDEKPVAPPADEKAAPKSIEQLSLEELLALGLKNNPDVLVADAKLREAEAEYSRARLQLSQKIAVLRKSIDAARKTVDEAKNRQARTKELYKVSAVSAEEMDSAELLLLRCKAELAKLEAEFPYLLGMVSPSGANDAAREDALSRTLLELAKSRTVPGVDPAQGERGYEIKMPRGADKLRELLDKPVNLKYDNTPLKAVLEDLQTHHGLSFLINLQDKDPPTVTLNLQMVSIGAALQALEDTVPYLRFTVRDYGILVTCRGALPPNALSVHDFWKALTAKEKPVAEEVTRNTPAEKVEGAVKKVDSGDLILINVGSDAGLAKGHTLEVFRLEPKPIYLGSIRILEVKPAEAVGKVVGKQREPIKEGDRVTSQIVNK